MGADPVNGAEKFSVYAVDAAESASARSALPRIGAHIQTVECAVMDLADDIAYAVHDLDDFYRAGILQYTTVSAELRGWLNHSHTLSEIPESLLDVRQPGHSLERTWRRLQAKDPWIANPQLFRESVRRVEHDLVEGLLVVPYDGGLEADRTVTAFTRRWIDRLQSSVVVERHPVVRSGHVRLGDAAWHDVVVLKFVHSRFVLDRSDLAVFQRGQTRIISSLVEGFKAWLDDPIDSARAPRRLVDSVEEATHEYRALREAEPWRFASAGKDEVERLGQARAIVDYVASFTDAQAVSVNALLTGTADAIWETGRGL